MKVGVAVYYSDLNQYKKEWVERCVNSLKQQTYRDIIFFELNYGNESIESNPLLTQTHFIHKYMGYHVDAINFMYEWIFQFCDVAANVNIDDWYKLDRIKLLVESIQNGADIASANYYRCNAEGLIWEKTNFATLNIWDEFSRNNNVISNPCHLMHKRVFESGLRFDPSLKVGADLIMWKQCLQQGFKIIIRPEHLHYYRSHNKQVTITQKEHYSKLATKLKSF